MYKKLADKGWSEVREVKTLRLKEEKTLSREQMIDEGRKESVRRVGVQFREEKRHEKNKS